MGPRPCDKDQEYREEPITWLVAVLALRQSASPLASLFAPLFPHPFSLPPMICDLLHWEGRVI